MCGECADGMALDPATGLCAPCRLANASSDGSCSHADPARCDDDDQCAQGFFCHNVTGQCTACVQPGCSSCTASGACTDCLPGYWDAAEPINEQRYRQSPFTSPDQRASFQQLPTECKPCADAHCLACDGSRGAACERCMDGYFLDRATKLCKPVGG